MFIKENTYRLMVILLIIVFAGGLFLTVRFIKNEVTQATNPSSATVASGEFNFDQKTLDIILNKVK